MGDITLTDASLDVLYDQVDDGTPGTASSATTDAAGYSINDTVITLASAGTGTFLEGDIITFAGDANKYTLLSGDADVSNGGTITLAEPGLLQAIAASTTAITVDSSAGYILLNTSSTEVMKHFLSNPAWGAASSGTKTLNAVTWSDTTGNASAIDEAEFYDGDGTLCYSGAAGLTAGIIILPKLIYSAAEEGSLDSGTAA